nr:immunoglobulin heavy chain junction region [Mus musculus]
CARGAGPFDFW